MYLYYHINNKFQQFQDTKLTAYFKLCATGEQHAKTMLFHKMPEQYTWQKPACKWQRRKQKATKPAIGRMYSVSPADKERYYLRLLLLYTHGAEGYAHLRTVNGELCPNFQEAASKRGLLMDDQEWERCLTDASHAAMSNQLRTLFAIIMVFGEPADPTTLWTHFKSNLSEDHLHRTDDFDIAECLAYRDIDKELADYIGPNGPWSMAMCHIEPPYGYDQLPAMEDDRVTQQQLERHHVKGQQMLAQLNDGQRAVVTEIRAAIDDPANNHRLFFIDGVGGMSMFKIFHIHPYFIIHPLLQTCTVQAPARRSSTNCSATSPKRRAKR